MEKVFLNNEIAVAQNKWNVGKIVYGMCCRSRDETWHKDVSKANALQRKLKKNREPKTKTNKKKLEETAHYTGEKKIIEIAFQLVSLLL